METAPSHTSALALSGFACLLVLGGSLGATVRLLPPGVGFHAALLGAILGLPALGWALRRDGVLTASAALALLPVAVLITLVVATSRHPMIHDVSTDATDPPVSRREGVASDLAMPHTAAVRAELSRVHGDLTGLDLPGGDSGSWAARLAILLQGRGWRVDSIETVGPALQLHAVVESGLFRFQDDVLVRLRPGTGGVRLDVRSTSRIGKSDLGANAARVRDLLDDLRRQQLSAGP